MHSKHSQQYIPSISNTARATGARDELHSLSSIGPVPPVQHVQQYQGSMQPINYDSKIDNLAKTLDKVFQKLNKLDQIESRISNFETSQQRCMT